MPRRRFDLEKSEARHLAPYAQACVDSRGREYHEEQHPFRTEFQRDRDRIVHSRSFRRLEYKTQVFLNGTGEHYRTRMTHTIEVSCIARTITRALGLNGAEIVFNPSATVAGLSEYLWKLEQPAHAVANGYFIGAINRVGTEKPWSIGEFYGQSYFCDPRGQMLSVGSRDKDELVVADLDLDKIQEVRDVWQFYRDRRPESYAAITNP